MENAVKIVDSLSPDVANFVTSESSDCRTKSSNALAESDNSTLLLGSSEFSSLEDCTNDFTLLEKPESTIDIGNGCLSGEAEPSLDDTDSKSGPGPIRPTVGGNPVAAFSAKLIDEIVIELDRQPNAVKSGYRDDHLTKWPNNSDIDDSSSSSDEVYYSSDSSSSSSSSSTSCSSGNVKVIQPQAQSKCTRLKPKGPLNQPKTKGELTLDDLPPIQDLNISLPDEEPLEKIGIVYKLVDQLVLVQALKDTRPLDLDSVLFLEGRKPLGQVFDVLGPVPQPFYAVRFNSAEDIANKEIVEGLPVFCAPGRTEVTTYIFTEDLRRQKGSDASWKDNNEPPIQYIDYSDDEEERKAKQKRKAKAREPSEKDVEIVHETKLPHTVTCNNHAGRGRGERFRGRNNSSIPPQQIRYSTSFTRPTQSNNQFMRFQAPPPVFGHPPTFSRGPPGYGYANNVNTWPHLPENMGPMDGRSPFGFHFQGSAGPPVAFGHRPPFVPNGQNHMGSHYSMFVPPQEPSYFNHPQVRFGQPPPPPSLLRPPPPPQNSSFSPNMQQNSNFNRSQERFRPPPCTVPAGLFLPPPPPPPL